MRPGDGRGPADGDPQAAPPPTPVLTRPDSAAARPWTHGRREESGGLTSTVEVPAKSMWGLRDTHAATQHHHRNGHGYLEPSSDFRRGGTVVREHVRSLGLCPEPAPEGALSPLDRIGPGGSSRAAAVHLLDRLAVDLPSRTTIDRIGGRDSDSSEPSPGRSRHPGDGGGFHQSYKPRS